MSENEINFNSILALAEVTMQSSRDEHRLMRALRRTTSTMDAQPDGSVHVHRRLA